MEDRNVVAMEAMVVEVATNQEVDSVAQEASVVDIKEVWDTETLAVDTMEVVATKPEMVASEDREVVHLRETTTIPSLLATSEMLINVMLRISSEAST